jgi:hypothetical protein
MHSEGRREFFDRCNQIATRLNYSDLPQLNHRHPCSPPPSARDFDLAHVLCKQ